MPKYKQEMKPVFFQQWDSHLTEKCHVPVFTIPMSLLGARIKSFNDIIQQLSTDIMAPCAGSLQPREIITAQKILKRSKSKSSKRNKNVSIKHLNFPEGNRVHTWWKTGRSAGLLSSVPGCACHCWVDLCWHTGQRSQERLHACWVSPGQPWPRCTRTPWCWNEAPSCHHHLWGDHKHLWSKWYKI